MAMLLFRAAGAAPAAALASLWKARVPAWMRELVSVRDSVTLAARAGVLARAPASSRAEPIKLGIEIFMVLGSEIR